MEDTTQLEISSNSPYHALPQKYSVFLEYFCLLVELGLGYNCDMEESISLQMCRVYLGKRVKILIDQPYGTEYEGTIYQLNYGYVPGTVAPDGQGLDAYYLSATEPMSEVTGECIAIIHRLMDDDDKLILVKEGIQLSDEEIEKAVYFRERYYPHTIER